MLRRSRSVYEAVEQQPASCVRLQRFAEKQDEGAETKVGQREFDSVFPRPGSRVNGAESSSKSDKESQGLRLESASNKSGNLPGCSIANENSSSEDIAPLKSRSFANVHGTSRRMLRGSLKSLKLKWASFEEKSKSDKEEMGSSQETGLLRRPQKQGRKHVSFEDVEDLFETAGSLEMRWNTCQRKDIRRGSTCDEIEKTIFYEGHNLHKLRKAVVVREILQERFLF